MKHLEKSTATSTRHLHQERQGLQSTRAPKKEKTKLQSIKSDTTEPLDLPFSPDLVKNTFTEAFRPDNIYSLNSVDELDEKEIREDFFPHHDGTAVRTNDVIYAVTEMEPETTEYMDITGRFPIKYGQGNEYLLVAYNWDANLILVEPIINKEAGTITVLGKH